MLTLFDPKLKHIVWVDASTKGIGAGLLQNNKPIAFASKSLSNTEQHYVNIEREMLAVVFGCKHFHIYLFCKQFVVEPEHKAVENHGSSTLSRSPGKDFKTIDLHMRVDMNKILKQQLKEQTNKDKTLQILKEIILKS